MCHLELKFEILRKYSCQADFAAILNERESKISRVIHGRQMLTPEEAKNWKEQLGCADSLLRPVIADG